MTSNFLTSLWREGALAGAKPEHAYFVQVGLGATMTNIDIQEGKMIVSVGVAITHPAEFIVFNLQQKMTVA